MVVHFLMDAVAGARRTPGRLETGGVPPKTPATNPSFSVALGVLGLRIVVQDVAASFLDALLRQPYLRPRRCGDFGFVSQHKPAEHHTSDVPAAPDVEASCITSCRGRRVSFSTRRCGVTVCLQLRRSYFVFPCFFIREWFFLHVLLMLMSTHFLCSPLRKY